MFDAERLLGKVLSEFTHSSGMKGKKAKHRKSNDLLSGVAGNLLSGKGLLTAIGLGVGAYTIWQEQKTAQASAPMGQPSGTPYPPPQPGAQAYPGQHSPVPPGGGPPPPPIPPHGVSAASAATAVPVNPLAGGVPAATEKQDAATTAQQHLALKMIQMMVAAAHADGQLDSEEEKQILGRLQQVELSGEERQFFIRELHTPRSIEELTLGVTDPQLAKTLYSIAVSAIVIDTEAEREWLDRLASALGISKEMQAFLEG